MSGVAMDALPLLIAVLLITSPPPLLLLLLLFALPRVTTYSLFSKTSFSVRGTGRTSVLKFTAPKHSASCCMLGSVADIPMT